MGAFAQTPFWQVGQENLLLDPRNGPIFQIHDNAFGFGGLYGDTDTSNYQMGAVIIQLKQPIAYWSKNWPSSKKNSSPLL